MTPTTMEAGGDAPRFLLTPAVSSDRMLANMRVNIARGLPQATSCRAHGLTMSIAGGGPSLADTYREMDGWICAVNGSLRFLLERETNPNAAYACAIMDAGEHIADMIVADHRVRYYVASHVDPSVFDKLAGCDVRLWHISPESTEDPDGVTALLNEAYPDHWHAIGGGCTMGLRWINLGYFLGFRRFHMQGMDSSFRSGATHAYPDRADAKDRIEFCGHQTRPNFLAQLWDFVGTLNTFQSYAFDPIAIEVMGDGLLPDKWREWRAEHPDAFRRALYDKPLRVACVCIGDKYGDDYVLRLQAGVRRHLNRPHEFVCYTDRAIPGVTCLPLPADLPGWWAKVGLFKTAEPMLYLDLDVVVTSDLARLAAWDGFGIIRDYWQPTFNSSVMKLTGKESAVWDSFTPDVMANLHGDQDWISAVMPDGRTFPPDFFPSYKADNCEDAAPNGAMACVFHGHPKPHECGGWVADAWH